MNDSSDLRDCSRVHARFKATVSFAGGWEVETTMADVSLSGLFVEIRQAVALDTACDVALYIGDRREGVTVNFRGRVSRRTDAGLGIEIDEFDFEAFEYLRKVVLYNSPDPAKVEAEQARPRKPRRRS